MNHIAKDQTLQYVLTVVDDVLKVGVVYSKQLMTIGNLYIQFTMIFPFIFNLINFNYVFTQSLCDKQDVIRQFLSRIKLI